MVVVILVLQQLCWGSTAMLGQQLRTDMLKQQWVSQWATVEFESLFIPADFQCNF